MILGSEYMFVCVFFLYLKLGRCWFVVSGGLVIEGLIVL